MVNLSFLKSIDLYDFLLIIYTTHKAFLKFNLNIENIIKPKIFQTFSSLNYQILEK